ncbi:probable glutamate receptor [Armigeres subalbatus]|uniref:probable glutamate receptor n=1 Tax=Armigeres subalbatus TaxID=124917 RepID=UPI002ED2FCDF
MFLVSNRYTDSVDAYRGSVSNNGTRSILHVEIERTEGPDCFQELDNMNGVPIHLSLLMYPPYSYYEETVTEKSNARYHASFKEDTPLFLDGTEVTLILEFCHKYNCSVEVSVDEVSLWGEVFDNRTGTGILGSIVERRADIAVSAIYYLSAMFKLATYTHPFSRSGVTVLVPKPLEQPPWRTPFLSFSLHLWAAVIVTFCLGVLAIWSIGRGRFRILQHDEKPVTLSDSTMTMIGLYVEQNSIIQTDLLSSTILFISLMLAGFIIGNAYNGGLAGVMTIPQYEYSIDTTVDLANTGMKWGATADPWLIPIENAEQPYMKKLVSTYRVVDDEFMVKHTKMHDMGFVGERTEFQHFVPADFVDNEASTMLQLLKDDLYWASAAAVVTKTCPFKQKLNDFIMQIKQSGLQYFWELQASYKYLNGSTQIAILNARSAKSKSRKDAIKLTVSHCLGAYMILAIGHGLASMVFFSEIFHIHLNNVASQWKKIVILYLRCLCNAIRKLIQFLTRMCK